jgi:ribosomal protein S12 methylthiotransferase accessory factor
MTTPELFAGALGACIGVYIVDFCRRHDVPVENLRIRVSWRVVKDPIRIGEMEAEILIPNLDEKFRRPLLRVAESCLIHRTVQNPPRIRIGLETSA